MDESRVKSRISMSSPLHKDFWDYGFISRFTEGIGFDTDEYDEPPGFSIDQPRNASTCRNCTSRPNQMGMTSHKYGFEVSLNIHKFKPEDLTVKTTADNYLIIEGKREEMGKGDVFETAKFTRRYFIPDGIDPETLTCTFIVGGYLKVTAPRKFKISDRTLPITVKEPEPSPFIFSRSPSRERQPGRADVPEDPDLQ